MILKLIIIKLIILLHAWNYEFDNNT